MEIYNPITGVKVNGKAFDKQIEDAVVGQDVLVLRDKVDQFYMIDLKNSNLSNIQSFANFKCEGDLQKYVLMPESKNILITTTLGLFKLGLKTSEKLNSETGVVRSM